MVSEQPPTIKYTLLQSIRLGFSLPDNREFREWFCSVLEDKSVKTPEVGRVFIKSVEDWIAKYVR